MTEEQRERLRKIKTFKQLIAYLRDELDWPIEDGVSEDDLTYDWSSDELGLDESAQVAIKEIKQLRPLEDKQPWGIFFINFEKKQLPIVILRRILNALIVKKRASANKAHRVAWAQHDLLFISAYGDSDSREITFAYFSDPPATNPDTKPTLKVLGWSDEDTGLNLDFIAQKLHEKLIWPKTNDDLTAWRKQWSEAFQLRPRQVIRTSEELALRLADFAKRIRARASLVLKHETERGPLRKLMAGFKAALIHNLKDDDFADMYAQTITYGLFSAAVSRTVPGGGTAVIQEDAVNLVPMTNPFLREMLRDFLRVGGRKDKLEFDELGIQEVVDLLNSPDTHLEAILRDFGKKTRQEDPVIHFYELFLKEYDKKKKVERGVFYTPQPVVSYIVRSVHELLKSEFGLEDGLASTITWGEMIERNPGMELAPLSDVPGQTKRVDPQEPFVQILDPATGTATFLVEVIDVIHKTLVTKWQTQGFSQSKQHAEWNSYVPRHLLPRLYGYELMMAPYAIAHMKLPLKLRETGFTAWDKLGDSDRARIYLTNALEPKILQLPQIGFDALAHEAAAVNEVKWHKRFTVIIGNPPYSEKSKNENPWINRLMERYKTTIRNEEAQIKAVSNDYVKFLCFAQHIADITGDSIVGVITSNGFLDGRLFRDLRREWSASFHRSDVLNLHGSGRRGDAALNDENVFDILQGVSILISRHCPGQEARETKYAELLGQRSDKYDRLSKDDLIHGANIFPHKPLYLFTPSTDSKTSLLTWSLSDIFGTGNPKIDRNRTYAGGFKTRQDSFTVAFDEATLHQHIVELADRSISETRLREKYHLCSTAHFEFAKARNAAQSGYLDQNIRTVRYRPFDDRPVIWAREVLCEPQMEVSRHLFHPNLCLVTSRVVKDDAFRHVSVARGPVEVISLSSSTSTNAYMFPLYRYELDQFFQTEGNQFNKVVNLATKFISEFEAATGLKWNQGNVLETSDSFAAESILGYLYAILHSPGYRSIFADELLRDFPIIPLPIGPEVFRALSHQGTALIDIHLLTSPQISRFQSKFIGHAGDEIEKVWWAGGHAWIDKIGRTGFSGISEDIWNFHIGGYQVCEKWLKDRKGRMLSEDEIQHYQQMIAAIAETIRLSKEIEETIEIHGGWSKAFQVKKGS